ncbi:MAG: class I SAM-dependent methyltransferase, partial [bacterium]
MKVPCVDFIARRLVKPLHASLVLDRHLRVLSEHMCRLLPPDGCTNGLDVGCGSGRLARRMMELLPGVEITGTDVVVRRDAVIPVIPYDGRRLPCADQSFDFTMIVDVLHHTDNPLEVLRECRRVSRHFVLVKDHICESRWDGIRL